MTLSPSDLPVSANDPELPPLDGTFTVDQLYEWQNVKSPDATCFTWIDNESEKTSMNWREICSGIDRAVEKIQKDISDISEFSATPHTNGHASNTEKPIVVGILANTELISYSTFFLGLLRLTHPSSSESGQRPRPLLPFPMSTRNSPAATAHLIRKTDMQYIYVSEGPMADLLHQALGDVQDGLTVVELKMPTFPDLYPPGVATPTTPPAISPPWHMDSPGVILHSSGSTAFPKPITLTHRTLLEWTNCLSYGGMKTKGETWAVHTAAAFHAMGVLGIMWAPAYLLVRAAPSPHVTHPPPTPEYYLSQIIASRSTVVYGVPSFLEAWAEDEASIQALASLKVVMYGGAPLSVKAGTLLRKRGVNLRCAVGATEYGQICIYPTDPFPEGYDWIGFSPIAELHFVPQDEENIFEVVFKEGPRHHLSVHNTHIDGVPAYASNDLVEQHPTNKMLWRIVGRKDDQIMLSTGEKTNPGPLEQIITRDKHVKGAVLFGRGRLQNGVIVEPASWADFTTETAFRDAIWPSVEEANAFAPSHSRIFKEMILVASPGKPFTYTAKGTPRRGGIIKDYEPEIEALYTAVKESSQIDIKGPCVQKATGGWSVDDTVDFIRKVVHRVMKGSKNLGDDEDFFKAGCDSLEATYIRNTILRCLRESAPACHIHKLPTNFVYQHPNTQQLGMYVAKVSGQSGTPNGNASDSDKARIAEMDDMVEKYTRHFPTHVASTQTGTPPGEVILLTGSTGGLGSQILAQLFALPTVSTIYAFNRPSKTGVSPHDRHRDVFVDRGNNPAILSSEKIQFVEGDTSVMGLGISEELFNQIRVSVTTIIHNAWQVDFKMMLPSFEPAVRGVRNLIDLALRSPRREPPRLLFTSTIGILHNWLADSIPEAPITDSNLIAHSGYGSSKWVSERILLEAAAVTPLKPVIIRVGQLSGGFNGCWNVQEWFPSLVRGSQVLGCIPDNEGLVSWVPLYAAAAVVLDLRESSSMFAHLVHPRPVPWTVIAQHVARSLKLPLVSYETWLSSLQSAAAKATEADLLHNPALRLLEFFIESEVPSHCSDMQARQTMGLAMLETRITAQNAPSLGQKVLSQMREEDVNNWISYWRQKGFLEA